MSILINKDTRVICQGFTGKQGRAMTDCLVDSRSMASARTWVKPDKHPVNVCLAERAHRKCALENERSRKRNSWSGLACSATDGSDNVSQCGCYDNHELIL